jgi:hypothetical protein
MGYFGLSRAQLPAIRIVSLFGMTRWAMKDSYSAKNLAAFLNQFAAGKVMVG